jgi:hypothetical protein
MIISLYKIWQGKRFVIKSIESIYEWVHIIIVVSCERSWLGEPGNNVREVILDWKDRNDIDNKICLIDTDVGDQRGQYEVGFKKARSLGCDWLHIIDTDEVWNDIGWRRARWFLRHSKAHCLSCIMPGYIKSEDYLIEDLGRGVKPVVFVRPWVDFSGVRGGGIKNREIMTNVSVDHYTAVRNEEDDIFKKFATSTAGDLYAKLVDMRLWKKRVWDRIPYVRRFHYNVGSEKVWDSIKIINRKRGSVEIIDPVLPIDEVLEFHGKIENPYGGHWANIIRDQAALIWISRELKCNSMLEIGTWEGYTARLLWDICGFERMSAMDICQNFDNIHNDSKYHSNCVQHGKYFNGTKVELIKADSTLYVQSDGENYDHVFIDANHDYEHVFSDFGLATALANKVISFHDYQNGNPGVDKFIDELKETRKLFWIKDTAVVYCLAKKQY